MMDSEQIPGILVGMWRPFEVLKVPPCGCIDIVG